MNKIVGKDESNPDKNNLTGYQEEKTLCPHCKRTATNGIKCKGICVADSDY
jgi:hypothetical protein